ncbi:hypothetical protein O6P43_029299 [Quillaja saponaria]|uniref:Uncharacterized protein n=1 Tax=Quillaja saponaria TaxID=32244 RepID=A0AAD7KZV0_QUISA|nr:hypothetical protein O6P43_029299 [Quillaja saponaria]
MPNSPLQFHHLLSKGRERKIVLSVFIHFKFLEMANFQVARLITEVAPPRVISVAKRRSTKILDTIAEEENDFDKCLTSTSSASSSLGFSRQMKKQVLLDNF